ncbi:MAG: hypothetical protein NTX45_22475 [Proteobacteria bacterium]|nr:hypothetical protein [Pseudomonadota bacterium]
MSPVIRITDQIYSRLEKHSQGFGTPANVIERLLDHFEETNTSDAVPSEEKAFSASSSARDTTKYLFNGNTYKKNGLVLAVVKAYMADNPDTSYQDLQIQFPKELQGSNGVFNKESDALAVVKRTGYNRHFLDHNELIRLADCTVAVSTQWGIGNINNFVQQANSLGYTVEPV